MANLPMFFVKTTDYWIKRAIQLMHSHSNKSILDQITEVPGTTTFTGTMDDITDGTTYKKVSTTEKSTWNNKLSSISKANVEAVLTGEISTHTHAGGGLTQQKVEGILWEY